MRAEIPKVLLVASFLACTACGDGGGRDEPAGGTDGGNATDGTGASPQGGGVGVPFGQKYEGGEFHLGPVDYDETQWHNACAPATKYAAEVRELEGSFLAGIWSGLPGVASYCDACIQVTTAQGKSALLRVVTYGDTTKNSIDVSPDAYAMLDSGEYPRSMSFQFAKCPDTGPMLLEFQTEASEWWTSFWLRNPRLPVKRVEVKSAGHASFVELTRGGDGTLTDASGFGAGPFSLRITAIDDAQVTYDFAWPSSGLAGQTLRAPGNFP